MVEHGACPGAGTLTPGRARYADAESYKRATGFAGSPMRRCLATVQHAICVGGYVETTRGRLTLANGRSRGLTARISFVLDRAGQPAGISATVSAQQVADDRIDIDGG
jgi:hypothetical protein